jgi:hypothetical protein
VCQCHVRCPFDVIILINKVMMCLEANIIDYMCIKELRVARRVTCGCDRDGE